MTDRQLPRERLEFLFAATPAVVYAFDAKPPHPLTFVGAAVEQQLGYSPAECLIEPTFWIDRVHPEDRGEVLRSRRDGSGAGQRELEYRFRHKNGLYRWLHDQLRVVSDLSGEPIEAIGFCIDVTDRRQAEDALRDTQERYRALFDEDLAGIFMSTIDGRLLSCNAAFARILGFDSIAEALACDLYSLYERPADRDALWREVQRRRRLDAFRAVVRRRDGTAVPIVANMIGRFDVDGRLHGIKGYVIDDTARARAEDELRSSEQRYRELFENANDIVFTAALDLTFTSLNATGEAISGYSRAEALETRIDDIVVSEDRARVHAGVQRLLAGAESHTLDLTMVTRAGRRVPIEVSTRLIRRDGEPVGIQGIARDVSERKALEAQVHQAQKMEAVGQLAGGLAHDFNNLLTVIIGYAEALADTLDGPAPCRTHAVNILCAAARGADLTRQLLAFSRRQTLAPAILELNDVLTAMEPMIARLVGEDIELQVRQQPELRRTLADRAQIEQVVMNLVVNARDAMPHGGRLTIETANVDLDEAYAAMHAGCDPGCYVRLTISDTGVGMDAATQARIFEPFFTTKEEGKGTGLGLSTVYGIVKQSGGNIRVSSEPGSGTTFTVHLPQAAAGDGIATAPAQVVAPPPAGTETILLVEDDPGVREFSAAALAASGYSVLTAATPRDAQQLAGDHAGGIDLLLTDVVMPGASGRSLAAAMTAMRPGVKVLYMSGYTRDGVVQHGLIEPGGAFIAKPFNARDLRVKVREVLDAPA